MNNTYGIAKTNNELVIFLGNSHIQFKFVDNKLKIRKYDSDNFKIYFERIYNPKWELLFTLYK